MVNGSRGTVVAVDEHQRTITGHLDGTLRDEPGRVTTLPVGYLDAGYSPAATQAIRGPSASP